MSLLRPDLASIQPYTRPASELEGKTKIRLHMNEAPSDWPQEAREALLARLSTMPFNLYPERQAEITERLRLKLGAPEGGLVLGPSSGNVLDLVALAGLCPGDKVAYPDPGFSLYPLLITRHRGVALKVPVGTGFPLQPWFEALEAGARQLWITLPNNPTGAWISPEELEPLLKAASEREDPPLVVLDEAYAEFAPYTFRLFVDRYPNVVLLRTFSKALASAGWRLGYLLGDPAIIGKMAALQLPYSIPTASLEALDVALDFAPLFDQEIRATARRRDRLAASLTGYSAVPSKANYLYIAPDPGPALAKDNFMVRSFAGTDAARVSMGTEPQTLLAAKALGGEMAEDAAAPARKLLVLDIDGVMIDAEISFAEAVSRAVQELVPGTAWSLDNFRAFKHLGGFNNDFRLAAGGVALAERGEMARLWKAVDIGFPDLEARIQELEPTCKDVVQRHYAITKDLERPLVTKAELDELGWDVAIYTGRPPEELLLAEEVLGFQLPAICDFAPHLRKPLPTGLLQLADAFRSQEVVFAGDTRDDAAALRAAREQRPEVSWSFAAIGPDRDRFAQEGDFSVETLRDLLAILKGGANA